MVARLYRSTFILFISWYPACLFSGCSLRSKVSWHQEGLAWERVWGYFCGNASGLRHTESILINWILLVWAPLICHLHILSLGIEVHKVMVHPIANIWGEVCFTKSKVCHDVMRRLLAGVPKGKRQSVSPRTAYADLLAASPSWGHCSHWTLPWKRWWPLVAKNIEIIWNHTLSETMLTFKPFLLNLYSKVDFSCQCTAKTRSSLKFCERKVLLAKMSVSASRNLYRTTRKVSGFHDLVSVMRQFTSGRGLIFWWPFLVSFVCQN